MAVNLRFAALVLVAAVAGCGSSSPSPSRSPTSSGRPSARAELGGAPVVRVVTKANFQSPSHNITCDLTAGAVRCEIVKRAWQPPPKPATCQLGWGHGTTIENGKADFVCAGDTIIGTAAEVLPYGSSLRAGTVRCDSENTALRCLDEQTHHGFTLAVANYNLF
jgi:hypothetical protein